mgnify:FL=1
MKNLKMFSAVALIFGVVLFSSCSDLVSEKNDLEYGSISINSETRAVFVDDIKSATVKISGFDSNGKKFEKSAPVTPVEKGKGTFSTIEQIPVTKNAVVQVQAFGNSSADSKIDGITMYAVCDIQGGKNTSVAVNWESSKKGKVFAALLEKGENLSKLTDEQLSSIYNAIPSSTHASLIDAESIATAFKAGTLTESTSYVLNAGTVKITANGCSGCTIQVSDPNSKISSAVSGDSAEVTVENVAPGTWNVYAVKDGAVVKSGTVTVESSAAAEVVLGNVVVAEYDGIKILVAKSLNYPLIHYWDCSDKASYSNTTWPGIEMDSKSSDSDYVYEFKKVSSVSILITNSSKQKLCNDNMVLSEKGTYRITASGAQKQSAPVPPTVTVPSKAYLGGSFTITVSSESALTQNTVSINGVTKTLVIGSNTFNVSDFTSSVGTISVLGTVSNSAGSKNVSGSISVAEKPVNTLVTNFNELRIYQVMVASFQDGDPSIGFTQMWGPDTQTKGGDLQGIIEAIPYIKTLGCNALWMTPIFNSNGSDKLDATGYFAYDYFNIDPHFGTMEKFDELVALCHENGINVILDGVFGHNKGKVASSPSRNGIKNPGIIPSTSNPVDYANNSNSLKYYSDVARYWITEHKIDGWRFDQCYQVGLGDKDNDTGVFPKNTGTNGHNYWYDIRKVVEEAASSNGNLGTDWGTLGYMVGEHWHGDSTVIQMGSVNAGYTSSSYGNTSNAAKGYGLNSCFDFPAYYKVVQGFAQEWGGTTTENITTGLSYLYKTYSEKGYSCKEDDGSYETYYPNFMLSNHDLFRVGDLINKKYNDGFESDNYAKRNMVLLAAQAAYTGPITIYYGDEIGDHNATTTTGWGTDNVARSSGKISGFNEREQKIHKWTQKCLEARSEHEALWNGSNEQIIGEKDFYVAKKVGGGETIYIAFNYNSSSSKSFSISGNGTDLLSDESFSGTVTVPALSARFILVK